MRTLSFLAMIASYGPAFAQSTVAPSAAVITDEIIVRGKTAEALRFEIEQARDAVFARFNEINSTDEFDIHCTSEIPTGSRMPRRVCAPAFLRVAQARGGRDAILALQGWSFGGSDQYQAAWASHRQNQLAEEMRGLAEKDEQLLRALERLVELEQIKDGPRKRDER